MVFWSYKQQIFKAIIKLSARLVLPLLLIIYKKKANRLESVKI